MCPTKKRDINPLTTTQFMKPLYNTITVYLFIYFIVIIHKRYKIVYMNIYKDIIVTVIT